MSTRARDRRRRSHGSTGKTVMLVVLGLLAMVGAAIAGGAIWVLSVANSADSVDELRPNNVGANTKVYDAAGNSLGYVQSDILRTPVKLKEIPKTLQQGTIAIEDANFYEHDGVDPSAIIRAGVANFEAGEIEQGASTITQQLVRNLYIANPEDTLERKIQEAKMAMEYEEEHSKNEILNEYLNTATYGTTDGRSAVGVGAAADVFFNKNVKELGLRESALLAGLPQAPSEYNPFTAPDEAVRRRNEVLDAMANEGFISREKAERTKEEGLGLERGDRFEQREQPFFFDYVQDELIKRYGVETVRQGGLKVYTTLQPDLQAAAEDALTATSVPYAAARALVSTDTENGKIIAMASTQDYGTSQFNLAADGGRQPGSSFKPFVLTAAVDQGMDPDTTYYSGAGGTLYPPNGEPWTVASSGGSMSLRAATTSSVNGVFARLGIDVGPENFDAMAKKLGIESKLFGYYPEALGGTTVCCTVLEMSNAYATLANGGVHHEPTAIDRVEFPNGDVDKPDDAEGKRVISDGVAYTVADVMKGPLDSGTATCCDIPCPASGKTGTTDAQADAWFVGYTPDVSTAVWTGNPNSLSPMPGYGADLSAPTWQAYMNAVIARGGDLGTCEDFPAPEDPAELSAYSSSQTTYDSSTDYSTDPVAPAPDDGTVTPAPETDADGDGYPDDAYAPGVDDG